MRATLKRPGHQEKKARGLFVWRGQACKAGCSRIEECAEKKEGERRRPGPQAGLGCSAKAKLRC